MIEDGNQAIGLTFAESDHYALQMLEAESSASVRIQAEVGDFTWTDTELTFTAHEATCPGAIAVYAARYTVSDGQLALTGLSGGLIMKRAVGGNAQASIIFGCFYAEGFQPSPLAPVANR